MHLLKLRLAAPGLQHLQVVSGMAALRSLALYLAHAHARAPPLPARLRELDVQGVAPQHLLSVSPSRSTLCALWPAN